MFVRYATMVMMSFLVWIARIYPITLTTLTNRNTIIRKILTRIQASVPYIDLDPSIASNLIFHIGEARRIYGEIGRFIYFSSKMRARLSSSLRTCTRSFYTCILPTQTLSLKSISSFLPSFQPVRVDIVRV